VDASVALCSDERCDVAAAADSRIAMDTATQRIEVTELSEEIADALVV